MKVLKNVLAVIAVLFLSLGAQGQELRIDIVTFMNDPSQIQISNDSLLSATSGGFFIYDLNNNTYQSWTVGDGFYSQRFSTFTRTSHNILALGSIDGILSFLNLGNQSISNEISLRGNRIIDIISVDDTLWVLAEKLVAVYNYDRESQRFGFVDFFQNFGSNFSGFTSIHYSLKQIWIGSDNGIFKAPSDYIKYNLKSPSNWTQISTTQGLPSNSIFDITGTDSTLFVASGNGLVRIDSQGITPMASGLVVRRVRHIDGEIFVSDDNTIFKYENGNLQALYNYPSFTIKDFNLDDSKKVWVAAAQQGIIRAENNNRIFIDGPGENYIGDIYLDGKGRLWCTSSTLSTVTSNGIFLKSGSEWVNFKFTGPGSWLGMSQSLFVLEDTGGNIWISAWNGGITIFDSELNITTINRFSTPGELRRRSVSTDDTIQVSTPAELQTVLSNQQDHPTITTVTDFLLDESNQSIWMLNLFPSSDQPFVRFQDSKFSSAAYNSNNWRYYSNPETGEWSNHLIAITKDIYDIFWFATDREGIYRMQIDEEGNRTGWDEINENSHNIKSNEILDIEADEDGYVWIGTKAGLSAYLSGTVFDFREEYQPVGFRINDIFIDSQGNKWFATEKGLSVLRSSGSPFAAASWAHIVPRISDVSRQNAFRADLPSENIHSVFLDEKSGDIYLGTDSGIAIIHDNPFTSSFTSYNNIRVGPNPFVISEDSPSYLRFFSLIAGSEVKILTADGRLVRRLNPNDFAEVQGSQAQWDGRNMEGELVATGVYIYLANTKEGDNSTGKFLVIRE